MCWHTLLTRMCSSTAPLVASPTSVSSLAISTTTQTNPGNTHHANDDLCPIIKSPTQPLRVVRRRVGSISDKSGHNYDLFSRAEAGLTKSSMTLSEVYSKQNSLSNRNRVQLALMLAWSVLQISSTSWLKGKWTKDNIFLVMDPPNQPLPYLSHRFESARRDSLLSSTLCPTTVDQVGEWVSNTSLFALGVFLLEMCFDSPIEDLATAKEKDKNGGRIRLYPDSNGQAALKASARSTRYLLRAGSECVLELPKPRHGCRWEAGRLS